MSNLHFYPFLTRPHPTINLLILELLNLRFMQIEFNSWPVVWVLLRQAFRDIDVQYAFAVRFEDGLLEKEPERGHLGDRHLSGFVELASE